MEEKEGSGAGGEEAFADTARMWQRERGTRTRSYEGERTGDSSRGESQSGDKRTRRKTGDKKRKREREKTVKRDGEIE